MITFEIVDSIFEMLNEPIVIFRNGDKTYRIRVDALSYYQTFHWRYRCTVATNSHWTGPILLPAMYEARKACIKHGLIPLEWRNGQPTP